MLRKVRTTLVWMMLASSLALRPAHAQQEPADTADAAGDPLDLLDVLGEVTLPREGKESLVDSAWIAARSGRSVSRVVSATKDSLFDAVRDAAVPLGVPFDAALVSRVLRRLWESGHYRDVRLWGRDAPGGVELVIDAKALLRVSELRVSGNDALDKDDIGRAVEWSPERTIVPEPEELRRLRRRLLEEYTKRGYREASAELRLETTRQKGKVALVVDVVEGEPDRYSAILLPGLPEDVPKELLLRRIGLPEGALRNDEELERAQGELVERLAEAGYPDARTTAVRQERVGNHELRLFIDIAPGLATRFEFTGNERVRSRALRETLLRDGPARTTGSALSSHRARLVAYLVRQGFLFAEVEVARLCHLRNRTLAGAVETACPKHTESQSVYFEIEEGPMVEVAALRFHGNAHFDSERLRSEVFAFVRERLTEGQLFQVPDTGTVDSVGISDQRPSTVEKPSGYSAARARVQLRYVPALYAEAAEHLTELYREQGYLAVEVSERCDPSGRRVEALNGETYRPLRLPEQSRGRRDNLAPCLLLGEHRDSLILDISIREGVQTVVHELLMEGNVAVSSSELMRHAGLSLVQPYNEYQLREAAKEIRALYQSRGYMFAEATWKSDLSPDRTRARVVFQIAEGPVVRVGRIRVDGALTTSRSILVERLTLRRGDVITPKRLEASQDRLLELGVLDSVSVQMDAPDKIAPIKTLRVQVTEGKAQYLEMKAGLATVEGVRGGFEYGYLNIGGWALAARLRARANYRLFFIGTPDFEKRYHEELTSLAEQLEHHVLIGIGQVSLPRTRGLLGWGIDGVKEQVNEPAFSADRTTAFLRLSSSPILPGSLRLLLEGRSGIEFSDITVPKEVTDPRFTLYSRIPRGRSMFWVTGLKVTLDLRDNPLNPQRGAMLWVGGDWVRSLAGFGQETDALGEVIEQKSNLLRTQLSLSGYVPMGHSGLVLALSGTLGYIFHLTPDSTTWADRYFYVGGIETLRGFPEESLVPEDVYRAWRRSLPMAEPPSALLPYRGGEAMLVLRSELRVPIAAGFSSALFAEAGNLWRDKTRLKIFDSDTGEILLRPVAGTGLRYLTPLGPLSFDLGFNLNKRPHEDRAYWYFSVGSAF